MKDKKLPTTDIFQRLSEQFADSTTEEWRNAAEKLLKGRPFEKTLLTETIEKIVLQPIYHLQDLAAENLDDLPGQKPFRRGVNAAGYHRRNWLVAQEITCPTPQAFNEALHADLQRGLNAINLPLDAATRNAMDSDAAPPEAVGKDGVAVSSIADLAQALDNIHPGKYPLYITCGASNLFMGSMLTAFCKQKNLSITDLQGTVAGDPLGELARSGQTTAKTNELYDEIISFARFCRENNAKIRCFVVQADLYHDAGGDAVQELAAAMATGAAYLRALTGQGFDPDAAARQIAFQFAVGSQFFMEIAKLRAAKILWSQILNAFGAAEMDMFIHVNTARWNKTRLDPHVNMLRGTIEAFAAILGGCDSLNVRPFDELFRQPDNFSRRIARNIQLILREESHANAVADPAGGAVYVEKLTDELAHKSWQLFQEIEASGGMADALETGIMQARIEKTAAERANRLALRKDRLIGTNIYANVRENPELQSYIGDGDIAKNRKNQLTQFRSQRKFDGNLYFQGDPKTVAHLVEAALKGATIGEICNAWRDSSSEGARAKPLNQQRAAEPFELLRAAVQRFAQKHGKVPLVYLVNFGSSNEYRPRAEFSRGFFEIAGLQVVDSAAFTSTEAAAKSVSEATPAIAVICSSDARYPDIVAPIATSVKSANAALPLVLAGYPEGHVDAFRKAGVDAFIHLRANVLETLNRLLSKINVL